MKSLPSSSRSRRHHRSNFTGDDRRGLWSRQRDKERGLPDRVEDAREIVHDILGKFPALTDELYDIIETESNSKSQKLKANRDQGKDIRERKPRKRRSLAMPQPPSREESSSYAAEVANLRRRISMEMREVLADHAETEKLYAERGRRESGLWNLTVESAFCDIDGNNSKRSEARKVALVASKYTVSLSSFSGDKRIRVCSGFVMQSNSCTNMYEILTSTTLVRCPSGDNSLVPNLKVKVCLPWGTKSDGFISLIDFHYNIVVVVVKSQNKLQEAILVRDVIKEGAVLAMGRFYDDGSLMCAQGEIRIEDNTFDCSELLMSSCKTTMAGVGGPLVDYSGRVLGINFYGENHTPFLSTAVVLRCLEHWKHYGQIIRPWLGFRYSSLDAVPVGVLEKCPYTDQGLYISNVAKGSPADLVGLGVGDVIIECAANVLSAGPEFGALLLDICKEQMETDSLRRKMTVQVVISKQKDGSIVRKTMSADVVRDFNYYRWPAPVPDYGCKTSARKHSLELL